VAAALCAFQDRCAAVRGLAHSTPAACLTAYDHNQQLQLLSTGEDPNAALDARFLGVDAAALQACLAGYATLDCRAESLGLCNGLLRFRSTLNTGEVCAAPDTTAVCDPAQFLGCTGVGPGVCQVCTAFPPPTTCTMDAQCASNHCELGACLGPRRKAVGETCTPGQCLDPMVCVVTGGPPMGTCQVPALLNAACGGQVQCVRDLQCVGGTCQPPLADGQPCPRAQAGRCANHCVFGSPDAAAGTCGPVTTPPAPGQPCINGSACGSGLAVTTPDGTGGTLSCQCAALGATGDPCDLGYQCASGHCLAITGACGPLVDVGGACRTQEDCASQTCVLTTGASAQSCQASECAPPPPDCTTPPPNTSRATAVALTAGVAAAGKACPGVETFYVLPGPFGVEATFHALVVMDHNVQHILMNVTANADYAGSLDPVGSTNGNEEQPARLTFFADSPDAVVVRVTPAPQEVGFLFHLLVNEVPSGGGACGSVPVNTSVPAALDLPVGSVVPATFCSQSANREFYWRIPGPLAMGSTVTVTADFDPDHLSPGLQTVLFDFTGGVETPLQNCFYARAFPDCSVTLTAAVPELYVRTDNNPSVDDRVDLTWTATVQ
jgi:hypothetical protein